MQVTPIILQVGPNLFVEQSVDDFKAFLILGAQPRQRA
jgi:hypothetical protein